MLCICIKDAFACKSWPLRRLRSICFFLSLYLRLPNGICLGKNERKRGALISSKFKCDLMHIHVYNIENPGKSVHTYGERGALLLSRKKKVKLV